MNEQITEQPVTEIVADDAPDTSAAEPTSIADHAKAFSPEAQAAEADADTPDLKPIRPVDQQRRDQGKFAEGHRRMRAKDAVQRINELTARAGAAERKLAEQTAELTRLRQQGASPARIEAAEQRVGQAERQVEQAQRPKGGSLYDRYPEPEPQEDDPKFGSDYTKYLRAATAWEARRENWVADQRRSVEAADARQAQVWDTRILAAVEKYPDYMEAAARILKHIPPESSLALWVEEHDLGEDVLYYLSKNPQELGAILRQPTVLRQIEAVTLLSQRIAPPPSGVAAATTSAPRRTPNLPPRPPNVVRTEAQRASETPPPTDGSLSIAEHRRQFSPAARTRR